MNPAAASRPNLLPTAAFVSLLVLALGGAALFALGYTNRKSAAALERLDRLRAAHITAVEARVSFKTQVQEWKNILLRGRDPADFRSYRDRFEQRSSDVEKDLASLSGQLAALGLDGSATTSLLAEHQKLGAAYAQALANFQPGAPDAPFAADAAVRGIDRKLNDDIDALSRTIEQATAAELKTFGAAADERYATLHRLTLGLGAVAVLAAFWLVFQARRGA